MRSAPRLEPQANDAYSLKRGRAFRVPDCARAVCAGPSATGRRRSRLRTCLFRNPLGDIGTAHALMRWRCAAVEDVRHFGGYPVGCHPERLVDMDVALRDAASGMPEQRGDRQFGKAEIAGQAGEGVPQGVRCDVGQPRLFADPIQHADHAVKMSLTPVSTENAIQGRDGRQRGLDLR
jgi:hypothetical protein